MTFEECCSICLDNKSLVRQFNRLKGYRLGEKRTAIERTIDKSCNYEPDKEAIPEFCKFVYEHIWMPLVIQSQPQE